MVFSVCGSVEETKEEKGTATEGRTEYEYKSVVWSKNCLLLYPYLVPTCMYLIDKERAGEQPGVGAGGEEQLETEEKPGEGLEEWEAGGQVGGGCVSRSTRHVCTWSLESGFTSSVLLNTE